jgi:hypothetical protein
MQPTVSRLITPPLLVPGCDSTLGKKSRREKEAVIFNMKGIFFQDRSSMTPAQSMKELSGEALRLDERFRFMSMIKSRCNAALALGLAGFLTYNFMYVYHAGVIYKLAGGIPYMKLQPDNGSIREDFSPEILFKE